MTSVNRQLPLYDIRNLTPVAVVVEDIATREKQEDLANVFTFIKLRRKSNPNKLWIGFLSWSTILDYREFDTAFRGAWQQIGTTRMDELSHYSPEPLFHEKEAIAREEEESCPLVVLIPVSLLVGEAGNGTSNQVSQVGEISYLAESGKGQS